MPHKPQPPTVRSAELRALATAVLPHVAQRGDCVAITGSAARGNARADSDLDLWILGKRRGRFVRSFHGVSVTLLCQTPAEAMKFENLCLSEVDALLLLDDTTGAFERLKAVWRKQRRRVGAEIIRSSQAQLRLEFERAETGSALQRATFLRLACWRLMVLRLYIDTGWRVPRLHLLRAELPAGLRRRLDEVLALPSAAACRRAVKLLPAALREVEKFGPLDGYRPPTSIAERVARAPDEAAFLARKELVYELLPRIFRAYGITDVRGVELLGGVAPKTREAFLLLEPPANAHVVKLLRRHAAALRKSI